MEVYETLPIVPLRDVVVFPHMMMPLFVGREKSINALEDAMNKKTDIVLAAQRDAKTNVGFATMHLNAQRDADKGKSKARERKRHLPMKLKANRRGRILADLLKFRLARSQLQG